jgi:two-component system, NarL family, nitrate/nitrite response regulator NarL
VGLKVTIIEDNARYRESMEMLFNHAPDFAVVASYGSAVTAVTEVEKQLRWGLEVDWNIALMDLELPGLNGIEATRRLKKLLPHLSVVMLTVFEEPAVILEAITAGADGYLLKKSSAVEILSQLRMISAGGSPLTSGVARTVLNLLRENKKLSATSEHDAPTRLDLTDREQEVLQELVRGLSYKQIADHLGISIETVRTYIRAIYRKLQVHSVAEAVARGIREKLI